MGKVDDQKHQDDVNAEFHLAVKNTTEGGKCLVRHESEWKQVSCSHRWQGYKRAIDDKKLYDWPRYASLAQRRKIRTDALQNHTSRKGTFFPVFPPHYRLLLNAPKKGEWDVEHGNNFKHKSTVPYLHNSHHVIPNSVLRTALETVGKIIEESYPLVNGISLVRGGLLRAGYNLNHKQNLIILPMDSVIAGTLNLPRHLSKHTDQNHRDYSDMIKTRLDSIMTDYMDDIAKELDKGKGHSKVKHELCKAKLESLSREIYALIVTPARAASYAGTLDDLDAPGGSP